MLTAVLVILILLLLWLGQSANNDWIRDLHFMLAVVLAIALVLAFHGVVHL